MLKQKHSVTVEDLGITIETGTLAKQANGAITIRMGDTMVFVAACAAPTVREGQDFFPLTVDYREKYSAAGRFPGGFIKREGRPSEKEILTSRLCDRPLRPLFPKGFMNEVQVQGMLLSADLINDPDILMVNGASAALMISDIPWNGPVGGVRVGLIDDEFVVNPTHEMMYESELDLIYVGNEKEMMMIEGSADQIPEEKFIEALEFAQSQVIKIIDAQKELAKSCNKEKKTFELFTVTDANLKFVRGIVGDRLLDAVFQEEKLARGQAVDALKEEATEKMQERDGEDFDANQIMLAFEVLQEEIYRGEILKNGRRADGRGVEDLRAIYSETGVLPKVHGSALFQRGETQNIAIATLGTTSDVQEMDGLTGGPREKSFILHYNFPNYSVGETGRITGPGRREIGHGNLAERSVLPVLPAEDDFPYTIRLVSEIFESNGSTSMASVCGGCMALMDAGVPITDMVSGISIGLVTETTKKTGKIKKYKLLTDILGAEDHFGDMDFKICGSREGITGFQLDLKIPGIPHEIAVEAIKRNTVARHKILDIMCETLDKPREEISENAPRIHQIKIDPEKIGALIGPGGKTIRRITEVSGAQVDINEDNSGRVNLYANSKESMNRAIEEINLVIAEIEIGKTYRGIVKSIKDFGCFVECLPGKEGLVHVSELADFRVNRVEDVCAMGDMMWVKCIGIDEKGRVRLSRKEAMAEREEADGIAEKVAAAKEKAEQRAERGESDDGDRPSRPPRRRDGDRRENGRDRGGDRGERPDRGPRRRRTPREDGGDDRPRGGGGPRRRRPNDGEKESRRREY